jgi:hypothetical protein
MGQAISAEMPGVRWEIKTITPDWAAETLPFARNKKRMPQADVDMMARDMQAGAWPYNGVAIIFDSAGQLIDGRKRLAACLHANASFQSLVFWGVEPHVFRLINTQRTRTTNDVLRIRREVHYRSLATALRYVYGGRNGTLFAVKDKATDQELFEILAEHPEIRESIAFAQRPARSIVRLPLFAALHFLCRRVDQTMADRFFTDFLNPEKMAEGSPERVLHDLLDGWRKSKRPATQVVAAAIVLAWNAKVGGDGSRSFRWSSKDGPFPALFGFDEPRFIGVRTQGRVDHAVSLGAGGSSCDGSERVVIIPEFGPEQAAALLANNTNNRRASDAQIQRYMRDILSGAWHFDGETIKVAKSGTLLDGQHRLEAIVRTQRAVPVAIAFDLDEKVFETLDRAAYRDFSSILSERGVQNSGAVSAAVRLLWLMEEYGFRWEGRKPIASNTELDRVLSRHPGIAECKAHVNTLRMKLVPQVAVLAEYLLGKIDPQRADAFLAAVAKGVNLSATDPRYVLREYLATKYAEHSDVDPMVQLAQVVNSWNAWVGGKRIRSVRWTRDDLVATGFPQPVAPQRQLALDDNSGEVAVPATVVAQRRRARRPAQGADLGASPGATP